jgi:hypothetical protein
MSILDSISQTSNNSNSTVNRLFNFIKNSNKTPQELALQLIRDSDSNKRQQLKTFLHNNGVTDEQLKNFNIQL